MISVCISESRTRLTELATDVKTRDARMKELERRKAEKERELAKHTKEDKEYNDEKTKNDKELATLKVLLIYSCSRIKCSFVNFSLK